MKKACETPRIDKVSIKNALNRPSIVKDIGFFLVVVVFFFLPLSFCNTLLLLFYSK